MGDNCIYHMKSLLFSGKRDVIKNRMTPTCNNTLALMRNVIDNVHVNNAFHIELMFILKAITSRLKGHLINRILHSWSFHKFHIK